MHERMSSVIELRFDFNDRDPGDLEQINRLLATMELTDVDVKDIKGYLATTQEFQNDRVVQTTYRYGLDSAPTPWAMDSLRNTGESCIRIESSAPSSPSALNGTPRFWWCTLKNPARIDCIL